MSATEGANLRKKDVAAKDGESSLLNRCDAARYLNVKEKTLESWVWRRPGYLPMCRVGRMVRYRKQDLDEFIEKNTVRPPAKSSDA